MSVQTWYDVAHPVKKQSRFEWIKAELARAYTLAVDAKPENYHRVLEDICSEAPPPPFLERRTRSESAAEESAQPQSAD